jgi:spermidine synthase
MSTLCSDPELAPATISEFDGVRYLHLGTPWVQGAMRLRKPQALELDYVQRMMIWLLFFEPTQLASLHAVQLGLGAAAITRFCHDTLHMRCTAVEINPSVIDACRIWFHLGENTERLQVLHLNAADYVADAALTGSAHVLCVDLYDHDAASPVLDDVAFYKACANLLADGGVMSVNLFGRNASFERSTRRMARAFGAQRLCTVQPTKDGNTVVLAVKNAEIPPPEVLAQRAKAVELAYKLPAKKWLRMLPPMK